MARRKPSRISSDHLPGSQKTAAIPPPAEPKLNAPLTRKWLTRFLLALSGSFAAIALVFSLYNIWNISKADTAKQALAGDDFQSLNRAVEVLWSPHIFAGYEPYHGFGRESARPLQQKASELLATGRDYSDKELGFLIHRIDHYLAAWKEARSASTPPVPGDKLVLASLIQRHENAISNTWVFVGYLLIVALIMAALLGFYIRLWRRHPSSLQPVK